MKNWNARGGSKRIEKRPSPSLFAFRSFQSLGTAEPNRELLVSLGAVQIHGDVASPAHLRRTGTRPRILRQLG
jgi:hypothetical protein